ncbi:prostate-associated microseminoprotein [Podarcis raffonei]|uniref:prostate-associated microseminoprotein n=1 Tax=Podarcis raffonei TaxID=65483 RepID=UPI0023295376|nr:prostate-associated microseminoprotein [Podarcis raffonei]
MAAKARLGAAAAFWAPLRGCLLLALLLQLPGARALCYFHAQGSWQSRGPDPVPALLPDRPPSFLPAPCLYKEKHFGPGESWQDANCSKCFCLDPLGVGCCDMMQPPVDFPAWCEAHYDSRACKISLVQKGRPRLPCVNNLEPGWGSGQAPEQQPGSRGGAKARLGRKSLEAKR